MHFIRKLRKNKFVVLAICVIIVSLVYTGVQKAINNHAFSNNEDIVNENLDGSDKQKDSRDSADKSENKSFSENSGQSNGGQFDENELDLELEGDLDAEGADKSEKDGMGGATSEENGAKDKNGEREKANGVGSDKIYIYVTGEVNVPGVVILNEGSRIADAINAAGGTTAKANVTKVNLVYVLEDGMKVNIPNDNDLKNNPDFEYITLNSGDGGREDYSGGASSGSSSSKGSASNSSNSSTSLSSGSEKKYSMVNINTATQTELETLPGIGPSLALKIINYRKENGKFSSIEEIKNVSGIGESKFENLKRFIKV